MVLVLLIGGCASTKLSITHPTNEPYGEQWQTDFENCQHIAKKACAGSDKTVEGLRILSFLSITAGVARDVVKAVSKNIYLKAYESCMREKGYYIERRN